MVKTGTLVDATVIEACDQPPRPAEGEVSAADPGAGFTKKHGKSYFGFKMHVGVDQGSELIRTVDPVNPVSGQEDPAPCTCHCAIAVRLSFR